MPKIKLLPLSILVSSLMLTSCALFNDDDLTIHNSFNPVSSEPEEDPDAVRAGGVVAKEIPEVPNAYCFKSICYATDDKITNTYKEGGANYHEYNVNNGEDFPGSDSRTNYDLYVPHSAPRNDRHLAILFIHGGAWVSGFKTDVKEFVYEYANRGYVTATIKYTLLKESMDDPSLSIFRNLDEIDACIASIKSVLGELGFDTSKTELAIGGASSGSHLTMLYSYSRGQNSPIPIKFLVDAVGPVDIKPENWKMFKHLTDEVLDGGITKEAIQTQADASNLYKLPIADSDKDTTYFWSDYQTMRIANGMCGLPYSLEQVEETTDDTKEEILNPNEASNSMTKPGGGEDLLSVTYWIAQTTNRYPVVCAYGGRDSIVGIAQYAKLETALDTYSIPHRFVYFRDSDHTQISKKFNETKYNEFINYVNIWCEADTIS